MTLAKLQITTDHTFIKDEIFNVQDFPEVSLIFIEKSRIDGRPFFKIENLENVSLLMLKGLIKDNETIGVIFAFERIDTMYSSDYSAHFTNRSIVGGYPHHTFISGS